MNEPAGYEWLRKQIDADPLPHHCRSYIVQKGMRKTEILDGLREEFYPQRYRPNQTIPGHLEFALKYEGVHLHLIKRLFDVWPRQEILDYIQTKPTGKNSRRIWYLYESFSGDRLSIDDLTKIGYADLIDQDEYFTVDGVRSRRHRIHVNWLGSVEFCPFVRRVPELTKFVDAKLNERMAREVQSVSAEMLQRAVQYLYTKETKSSFAIERQTPDQKRSARFIELLKRAGQDCSLEESRLVSLQNAIVEDRFAENRFRNIQNYVGETAFIGKELIHFTPPRPEDINNLMAGLKDCCNKLRASSIDPVVGAAVVSFAFVFLHPFEDGNGRIHRFLIHDYLADQAFTPKAIIFPISAAMLNNMPDYDAALEGFSQPLLSRVNFQLNPTGEMTVTNETADYFRYMDMTSQAIALYSFLERTIENEFVQELDFLEKYDHARQAMRGIVDMPDRQVDLFIRLAAQNQGKIAKSKRERFFDSLTLQELEELEECVQNAFSL